jgi:predicted amidophosphoribosyltransferase
VLEVLLPTVCPACERRGPAPCAACWRGLKPAPPLRVPAGLDACRALLLYEGPGRELVARLKYRNARSALAWLAAGMAELVAELATSPGTIVTWAPTTAGRRRTRGFDQAQLLATRVARDLRLPARRLLVRPGGPPQTGRAAAERASGVVFSSTAHTAETVIVVDDVITTGTTMRSAAACLRNAGTTVVIGLAAARTPLKLANRTADR